MTDAPRAQNPQAQGNPMHALAAGRIVGEVMKRLREGDCPTTPKFSNETLEDALLEVHRLFQREQEEHKRHESDLAATRAERDALAALVEVAKCPNCDGSGVIIVETTGIEPGCCGRPNRDGSCCGNPIPVQTREQEQQPCQWCDERAKALRAGQQKGEPT